jgi:hypothetical protein
LPFLAWGYPYPGLGFFPIENSIPLRYKNNGYRTFDYPGWFPETQGAPAFVNKYIGALSCAFDLLIEEVIEWLNSN